ncbi:transmembrane proteins 14C-domain-containing protein [Zopfochytrium polystomum]|nr:transmembrane proteins 14C-domain-containing protein [Zopfochytrium polystomum]
MPATDVLGYLYAVTVAIGGTVGYVRQNSTASLTAGLVFGALLALAAFRVSQNPRNVGLSIALSAALSLVMGSRFAKSGKLVPAGLVTIISVAFLIRYSLRFARKR